MVLVHKNHHIRITSLLWSLFVQHNNHLHTDWSNSSDFYVKSTAWFWSIKTIIFVSLVFCGVFLFNIIIREGNPMNSIRMENPHLHTDWSNSSDFYVKSTAWFWSLTTIIFVSTLLRSFLVQNEI